MSEFHEDTNAIDGLDENSDVSVPLGTGSEFADGMGDGAMSASKRKVGSGTVVLALVVVLAVAGLYSMRSLAIARAGTASGDKSLESTIESFLDKLTGETQDNTEVVMSDVDSTSIGDVLVDDRTEKQVTLNNVQKNPFAFPFAEKTDDNTEPVVDTTDPAAVREAERLAQCEEKRAVCEMAAAKLRLVMLMGGREPMANISGRVLHEGDTIYDDQQDIEFTVQTIDNGMVLLTVDDESIQFHFETVLRLNTGVQ